MAPFHTISPQTARRLAIARQRLAGNRSPAGSAGILEVVRDLRCVQIDPIRAVERSQLLVLWSRLGRFEPADLDALLWQERHLFEYRAHAASIVLTEDYPIFQRHMRDWASGDKPWMKRARVWLSANLALREHVLTSLRRSGPLASQEIADVSETEWRSSGWTSGRNVQQMLEHLWAQGEVMVSHRRGLRKYWDLSERCLLDRAPQKLLSWPEAVALAAQKSLRALGIARPGHIANHFTRGQYPGLERILKQLEADGRITRVAIADNGLEWSGRWYLHNEDLPLLEELEAGTWQPRTRLLSPFDNLICDRKRTEELFDFHFRIEIYTPKAKRQYGYYVLPILHGDRLVGRIDPKMDRKSGRLHVNAVYAEADAPEDEETGRAIARSIEELAVFLGAREISIGNHLPAGWMPALSRIGG